MGKFTHQHYEFLAKVLSGINNSPEKRTVLEDLCNAFADDNLRFDRNRFWESATGGDDRPSLEGSKQ